VLVAVRGRSGGVVVSETSSALLSGMLEIAVPLEIAKLKEHGGPSEADWRETHEFSWVIAEHGDSLLFRTTTEDVDRVARKMAAQGNHEDAARMAGTSSARMFVRLARALAVMAYCPGGSRLGELRWEVAT